MGNLSDIAIGKPGYLVALQEIEIHGQDRDGRVWAWVGKGNIALFKTIEEFCDYVDKHIDELDPKATGAASGSASTQNYCSTYLADAFKKVKGL